MSKESTPPPLDDIEQHNAQIDAAIMKAGIKIDPYFSAAKVVKDAFSEDGRDRFLCAEGRFVTSHAIITEHMLTVDPVVRRVAEAVCTQLQIHESSGFVRVRHRIWEKLFN